MLHASLRCTCGSVYWAVSLPLPGAALILSSILIATILSGVASVLAASWLSSGALANWLPRMISLSAGVLLGAAVLQLLPEAMESGASIKGLSWALLAGFVGFFLLEKTALIRHSHHHESDGHGHHHGHDEQEAGPGGLLILVGDSFHNFADGILIAAAFITDPQLGWLTAAAIAAHAIPQEVGDFIVLRNAGYSKQRALLYNVLSGLSAVLGGVLGYFWIESMKGAMPYVLILAASSFIYIALADLVPDMQRKRLLGESAVQVMLMLAGIALIALLSAQLHAH